MPNCGSKTALELSRNLCPRAGTGDVERGKEFCLFGEQGTSLSTVTSVPGGPRGISALLSSSGWSATLLNVLGQSRLPNHESTELRAVQWNRHFEGLLSAPVPLGWQPRTRRMLDALTCSV